MTAQHDKHHHTTYTPSAGELRLLVRVSAAEAAARTGLAGDSAEMLRVAADHGALDGERVLLSKFAAAEPNLCNTTPIVVIDPDSVPEL